MNKSFGRAIFPILLLFSIVSLGSFLAAGWLNRQGIDHRVLAVGNTVIFAATLAAMYILVKGGKGTNPQSFVRSMYGSFMVRFFIIIVVAFAYIMSMRKGVNKPALIICAGLYFVYSFLEISILMKMLKKSKDA